jgi:hypothetical protein
VYFDATGTPLSYFEGELYDVVIFPWAMSAAEIASLHDGSAFAYSANLLASWDFSAINPPDLFVGNDLTGSGIAASNIVDGPWGLRGVRLNGTDECFASSAAELLYPSARSFGFATLLRPGGSSGRVINVRGGDDMGWQLVYVHGTGFQLVVRTGEGSPVATVQESGSYESDLCYVVGGYDLDNDIPYLYVNDSPWDTVAGSWALGSSGTQFRVGCRNDDSAYYPGDIYMLDYYSKPILRLQARDRFARIKGGF